MNRLAHLRHQAAHRQSYRCCYCKRPIWEEDPEAFQRTHDLSERQAALFRSTAEHLQARCEGGRNTATNIAAACLFCNVKRHARRRPLSPERYERYVARRVERGRWLGPWLK